MKSCLPPFSWSIFLHKYPDEGKRNGVVGSHSDLVDVNARVNRMAAASGVQPNPNEWLIWPSRAWCHDYAVTKRHELLGRGWPSSSLLLAECFTSRGEGHMVLIADGLCLDNLHVQLLPWDSTGYDWSLPMQSEYDPNVWERAA